MSDAPIACTLTMSAYADRMKLIRRVGSQALESVERHSGHTQLRFRRDPEVARDLGAIREAEATCCAFLRLTLDERPHAIVLSIASASPDGAFMVDELTAAFAAGRPEVAIEGHAPRRLSCVSWTTTRPRAPARPAPAAAPSPTPTSGSHP